MDVAVYVKGTRLDLFADEKISINLSVKNISDISKLMADFTQTFSVPASPTNNTAFSHWYDSDVDGEFDANKRADAYIEVNTLPFRFGSVQLMKAIKKNGLPSSYSITFFGKAVNLSDLMGDYKLSDLDLSEFDHDYNSASVIEAMQSNSIASGDIYYPLISAVNELSIGSIGNRDLIDPDNTISYREFKPALREIRIIEAIEQFTGITFSRDFFGRSIFWNKFFWLHREAGEMKAFGDALRVNITSAGNLGDIDISVNTTTDTVSYFAQEDDLTRQIIFRVTPSAGYEDVPYKILINNNGVQRLLQEATGVTSVVFAEGNDVVQNNLVFFVSASAEFSFTTRVLGRLKSQFILLDKATSTPLQSCDSRVIISNQIPDLKIKEYFNSLVAEFNLILVPVTDTKFTVDTLDNWYDQGKTYDITQLVDINNIQVARVDVKKQISFKYKAAGTILAKTYATNNNIGYGDLEATFEDVAGDALKIESQFENMLFERLQDEVTGEVTDIQAGFAIDSELKPFKGSPISFYKNGLTYLPLMYISGSAIGKVYHTATEDNLIFDQVTNSLNFGADTSSYFYSPIEKSLYGNFYQSQINDLYNPKARLYDLETLLPIRILQTLKLNDRLIIGDKKYKISTANIDLTDGNSKIQVYNDFSPPIDSTDNTTPITVDSTMYTVDTTELTADMVSIHNPIVSFIINGISRNTYIASRGEEFFEIYVTANTNWTAVKVSTGIFGTSWFDADITAGNRSRYIRVRVLELPINVARNGIIRFTIGGEIFDLTIYQNQSE